MDRFEKISGTLFIGLVLVILLIPIVNPLEQGSLYNSEIKVEHEDIFTGENNLIKINSNEEIKNLSIYLNDSQLLTKTYDPESYSKIPTALWTNPGTQEGSLEELNNINIQGLSIIPKKFGFWCWKYYKSVSYIIMDTQFIENINFGEIKLYLTSNYEFLFRIEFFNMITENWTLIDERDVNASQSSIDLSFEMTEEILSYSSLKLRIVCLSEKYYEYLIDKLTLEYAVGDFNDEYYVDVSTFTDGYYQLNVKCITYSFETYENQSIVYIDNSPPEISLFSEPSGDYNDTDLISFHFKVSDYCETDTILELISENSSYTMAFGNNTLINYENKFLPSNYSFIIISTDSNGLTSHYSGEFLITPFDSTPKIITIENTITINKPTTVNYKTTQYPVYIQIDGNMNYLYNINFTYAESSVIITEKLVSTNSTNIFYLDVFNESITMSIFNINNSELIITENFTVIKYSQIILYNKILISVPSCTCDSQFRISIYLDSDYLISNFKYKLWKKESNTLILMGNLIIGFTTEIVSYTLDEPLLLEITNNETIIFESEFLVEYIEKPGFVEQEKNNKINWFLLIMVASLIIAILGLFVTIYKK